MSLNEKCAGMNPQDNPADEVQSGKEGRPVNHVDIVFDGPPNPNSPEYGHFVEVEDAAGKSIRLGEWVKRADGYWALRFEHPPQQSAEIARLESELAATKQRIGRCPRDHNLDGDCDRHPAGCPTYADLESSLTAALAAKETAERELRHCRWAKGVVQDAASDAIPWQQDGPIWKQRAESAEQQRDELAKRLEAVEAELTTAKELAMAVKGRKMLLDSTLGFRETLQRADEKIEAALAKYQEVAKP